MKVTYDYTDRGQLLYEVLDVDAAPDNDLFETVYDYDAKGRVASIQYPAFGTESRTVRYDYTLRGQLDTVHWDNDSENVEIEDRVYDGVGLLTDIDRPHFDENRQYDNANRLEFINNTKTGGDQIGRLDYDYDENGNKTSESFVGGPAALADWNFTIPSYDREDRFTGFVRTSGNIAETSVSLDRSTSAGTIGNIQSVTNNNAGGPGLEAEPRGSRGYSDAHALTTVGVQQQSFNFEGQLVSTHTGNNLSWDLAGRLEQAVAGGDTYHYGYDTDGRRVWKKKENENQFTVYAYGGPNVIAEFDVDEASGDAVSVHRNVFGTTIDELLLVEKDDGTQYGITRNQQWSVMAAYDFATGDIAKRFNYGVFGKRYMVEPDGTISDVQNDDLGIKLGYTSRRHDDETGLMYFRTRYYDTKTGEFISQDPLEYVDGMSMYRGYFVLNGIDPSGEQALPCSQICNMARKSGIKGGGGGVICFNNQKCVCVLGGVAGRLDFEPGECPIFDEIILAHERTHISQVKCRDKSLHRPAFRFAGDIIKNECGPRLNDIPILEEYLDRPDISDRCHAVVESYLEWLKHWTDKWCKDFMPPPVPKPLRPIRPKRPPRDDECKN